MKDYYSVLAISRNASIVEIKKSFRDLALTYHPDKNKAIDVHERFVEINEAFYVLSDPKRKTKYDRLYDRYMLHKNETCSKTDQMQMNRWVFEGQKAGNTYAKYDIGYFQSDILRDLLGNMFFHALFDGLGNLIEGAGDMIDDMMSDIE